MQTHADQVQATLTGLRRALRAVGDPAADQVLTPMTDKGLAHDHVRLGTSPRLARIPKQSQMGLAPVANLAYQRACFERAAKGGHTPRLHAVLTPAVDLPWGALIVEAIAGRVACLPQDLDAIARTLASLHALDLPPRAERAPLLAPSDPLAALHDEIRAQWQVGSGLALAQETREAIEAGLARLQDRALRVERPPLCLIAFDGHPGNFMVEAGGRAVLVDLEKCRYSYAPLDLAHATLYTSTTWDVDTRAVLGVDEIVAFHRTWASAAGPLAARCWPDLLLLREAMWLWSLTWCAKWLAVSGGHAKMSPEGEDWSHERSEPGLISHVSERVCHYLDPDTVRRGQLEFRQLAQAFEPLAPGVVT